MKNLNLYVSEKLSINADTSVDNIDEILQGLGFDSNDMWKTSYVSCKDKIRIEREKCVPLYAIRLEDKYANTNESRFKKLRKAWDILNSDSYILDKFIRKLFKTCNFKRIYQFELYAGGPNGTDNQIALVEKNDIRIGLMGYDNFKFCSLYKPAEDVDQYNDYDYNNTLRFMLTELISLAENEDIN